MPCASMLAWLAIATVGCGNRTEPAEPHQGLALGGAHACAWTARGDHACWGELAFGTDAYTARPAGRLEGLGPGVAEMALGRTHGCARMNDGSVRCWGNNEQGQLGERGPTSHGPRRVRGLSNVVSVSAGGTTSCAVLRDGSAQCWGLLVANDTPARIEGLENTTQIALADEHACALRRDGRVLCWGRNGSGQLGDGTTQRRERPTPIAGLVDVIEITAGGEHTCVRTRDGRVLCWGEALRDDGPSSDRCARQSHMLGAGNRMEGYGCRLTPVRMTRVDRAIQIASGTRNVCVLRADRTVSCWGSPEASIAGSALSGVVRIALAEGHGCAQRSDGGVMCWGADYLAPPGPTRFLPGPTEVTLPWTAR